MIIFENKIVLEKNRQHETILKIGSLGRLKIGEHAPRGHAK